jgi:hypothetical protein
MMASLMMVSLPLQVILERTWLTVFIIGLFLYQNPFYCFGQWAASKLSEAYMCANDRALSIYIIVTQSFLRPLSS